MTLTEPTPITFTTEGHKPVLIEDWLPIRELGVESVRERQASSALPPLSFLHIWWARAPLAAASGVQLTAVLPMWDDNLLDQVPGLEEALERTRSRLSDVAETRHGTPASLYRAWILWLCGVWGDTVRAQEERDAAKAQGQRLAKNPFSWQQAYKNKPSLEDLNVLHRILVRTWGRLPIVVDPTAGGGAIPFTASRFGLSAYANDLNPVAYAVLNASLRAPAEHGVELVQDLERWGQVLVDRCRDRLDKFFPATSEGERVANYLFTNTVACPRTGGPVPLAPNWWLDKTAPGVAMRPNPVWHADGSPSHVSFELLEAVASSDFEPDEGTVGRGDAVSLWDGLVIDGDYIKAESKAGRMWPTMYAVRVQRPKGKRSWYRYFRAPTEVDLEGLSAAENELERLKEEHWTADDILPTEDRPRMHPKYTLPGYGFEKWETFFSPRQLLVHGVFVEEWRRLIPEMQEQLEDKPRVEVILTLLALMQGKAVNWNGRLTTWIPQRGTMRSVFDTHDFTFKWTFAEFEGANELWPWCLEQLIDAYSGVAELMQPADSTSGVVSDHPVPARATVSVGSASALEHLSDASIECVNIDPPYYDNVMYAELADYFYIWQKRTLGVLHSEPYADYLTNKDDEAVANVARFSDAGRRRNELATFDYQQKMQAIFGECRRVLTDEGVMVVWFTHKKAEAWDTLGTAMMDAGFTIEASWPIATQPAASLHHAAKNSAKSTVILVCRKRRTTDPDGVFFDDIEADVRRAAQEAVAKFEADVGVGGVDLMLATYGPTLSVISRNWPVLSAEAGEDGRSRRLKPEEALAVARQEVARLRMARLVGQEARFDPATDFWLMAWETFQAREFPYDEARKLALGVGYDVDEAITVGLLTKRSGNVVLAEPAKRARRLRRDAGDDGRLETLVDAVHHLLNLYRVDGLAAARTWLADSGYGDEHVFSLAVQAAVRAVPRVRGKEGFSLEEAQALEDAVVALFGDEVELPAEHAEVTATEQQLDFTT